MEEVMNIPVRARFKVRLFGTFLAIISGVSCGRAMIRHTVSRIGAVRTVTVRRGRTAAIPSSVHSRRQPVVAPVIEPRTCVMQPANASRGWWWYGYGANSQKNQNDNQHDSKSKARLR